MKHRIALIASCIIILFASCVHAQGVPTGIGSLELITSSDSPSPGDSVTITVESYTADVNSLKITWTVNGKTVEQGMGATALTVTAPDLGKRLTINVSAATANGAVLNDSVTIGSGGVDLILENSGYVPPFFMGKISPSYQNLVNVIAVPHLANSAGTEYNPRSLVYQWKKNGSVLQDQSGYGKQSITMSGELIPRPYTMSVTVTSQDNSAQAVGYITVSPGNPSISFYQNDPLYGPLFNRSVGATMRIGSQKEVGVLAVPFGFDKPANGLGNLSMSWSINGVDHSELDSGDSVTLRAPDGQAGSSDVSLSITNTQEILQGVENSFSVNFLAGTSGQSASAPASF